MSNEVDKNKADHEDDIELDEKTWALQDVLRGNL